jgi:hypothetical protein
MAQARKPTRTTATKGLSDQEPNAVVTAVVTGSMSLPATTCSGCGCARPTAIALRITTVPTLSSDHHMARGTCRPGSLVSSAVETQASKPMKAQPATATAVRKASALEPPDSCSAPMVPVNSTKPCSRKNSSSAKPTSTDAIASAAMPVDTIRLRILMP